MTHRSPRIVVFAYLHWLALQLWYELFLLGGAEGNGEEAIGLKKP